MTYPTLSYPNLRDSSERLNRAGFSPPCRLLRRHPLVQNLLHSNTSSNHDEGNDDKQQTSSRDVKMRVKNRTYRTYLGEIK